MPAFLCALSYYAPSSAERICGASWLTLPAPRVRIRSPSAATPQTAAIAAENWDANIDQRSLDPSGEQLRRHAGNRLLAGRVDGKHDHRIGVSKRASEFLQKIKSSGVPVRLEDNVDAPMPACARRSQRGANLRGVVAVIVHHGNAARLAALLKAAIDAAESA